MLCQQNDLNLVVLHRALKAAHAPLCKLKTMFLEINFSVKC